jgi:hypothetical protein
LTWVKFRYRSTQKSTAVDGCGWCCGRRIECKIVYSRHPKSAIAYTRCFNFFEKTTGGNHPGARLSKMEPLRRRGFDTPCRARMRAGFAEGWRGKKSVIVRRPALDRRPRWSPSVALFRKHLLLPDLSGDYRRSDSCRLLCQRPGLAAAANEGAERCVGTRSRRWRRGRSTASCGGRCDDLAVRR